MNSIFDTLNSEQRDIVFSNDKRLFVNAGPGTGKTHTIVAFVVNLIINKHIPPHKIQILTFSKQASEMMKRRLKGHLSKEKASKIKVSTFHSLAYCYMTKDSFLDNKNQADEKRLKQIAGSIARKAKCNLSPEELLNAVLKIGRMGSYNAKKNEHHKWFVLFYKKLEEKNLWEFDFLINKMVEKLKSTPAEISKQRNKADYVIVDEFQDCNENQIELLKLLVGKEDKFLFVGDPDQMIYQWRGAKMRYSIGVAKHFAGVIVKNLAINYRSCSKIIEVANILIENNQERLPKVIKAYKKDNGRVAYKQSISEAFQLGLMKSIVEEASGSSAVLCHTNYICDVVFSFLQKGGCDVKMLKDDGKVKIEQGVVYVLTCHASKGLEFDNVIVPYLIDYHWGKSEHSRRLFYVCITRAKQNLYLLSLKSYFPKGNYVRCKPSIFLKEIGIKL